MIKQCFLLLILFFLVIPCYGQGCSDAGFCTAGSVKPNSSGLLSNAVGATVSYGIGEQGTQVLTPQFEAEIKVSDKSMVQAKIPFVFIKGDAGGNNGMGDVILTYNYHINSVLNNPLMLTVGTRIATGSASIKRDNIPLPMPYQLSLGTTDLILGARMQLPKGFSISIGFQQPIVNRNQNGFDSVAFKKLAQNKALTDDKNYFISSYLERKGDVMLRIDKTFTMGKTMVSLGVLPIYHHGNDKATIKNKTVTIENSKGLTLNVNAGVYYKVNSKFELSAIAAIPLIVRESRPDGLTRSFVFIPGLRYYL